MTAALSGATDPAESDGFAGAALALARAARYVPGMRWRSPLAGLVIIAGLVLYVIAVVSLADFVPDHILAETVYYLVAGIVWIWPAVSVIGWARRDEGSDVG